ncbi:MAG TPA: hypothetical protein VMT81_03795 [Candidatus Paceibacterota bacterium]|nr:hypothetical protein [Candidatus Paceibacterota bacterium]
MTKHSQELFKHLIRHVVGADVLDIGCGEIGYYWAMAYAHKVRSISFCDKNALNLKHLQRALDIFSPEFIAEYHADTMDFLKKEHIVPENYAFAAVAEDLLSKIKSIATCDFTKLGGTSRFDTILSVEAIECVDALSEFRNAMRSVYAVLNPGGLFLMAITPYDKMTDKVREYIDSGVEGKLNPGIVAAESELKSAGFTLETMETLPTGIDNYSTTIIVKAKK